MKPQGIYAITPDTLDTKLMLNKVGALLDNGLALLQYRNKILTFDEKRKTLQSLKRLCDSYQIPLIVNDDLTLAEELMLSGVHLGQSDANLASARKQLGVHALIGASCHNDLQLAHQAMDRGASYVAFGRFFPSKTKPDAPPADLKTLTQAKQQIPLPIVAIGGINIENAAQLIEAGADYLATVSALFDAEDSATYLKQLNQLFY